MKAPELCSLMLGLARVAYNIALSTKDRPQILADIADEEVQAAINNCDHELSARLWNKAKKFVYVWDSECNPVSDDIYDGRDAHINPAAMFEWVAIWNNYKFTNDIVKEWRLDEEIIEHGDTAKGWRSGMFERLGKDGDYKKFQKGWKA